MSSLKQGVGRLLALACFIVAQAGSVPAQEVGVVQVNDYFRGPASAGALFNFDFSTGAVIGTPTRFELPPGELRIGGVSRHRYIGDVTAIVVEKESEGQTEALIFGPNGEYLTRKIIWGGADPHTVHLSFYQGYLYAASFRSGPVQDVFTIEKFNIHSSFPRGLIITQQRYPWNRFAQAAFSHRSGKAFFEMVGPGIPPDARKIYQVDLSNGITQEIHSRAPGTLFVQLAEDKGAERAVAFVSPPPTTYTRQFSIVDLTNYQVIGEYKVPQEYDVTKFLSMNGENVYYENLSYAPTHFFRLNLVTGEVALSRPIPCVAPRCTYYGFNNWLTD